MLEITVYIDLVFFWNFLIDYILLWITGKIRKQCVTIWRRFFAAVIGAITACIFFMIPSKNGFIFILFYLIGTIFMLFICFGIYSLKQWIKTIVTLFLATFCTAGIFLAIKNQIYKETQLETFICMTLGKQRGTFVFRMFLGLSIFLPFLAIFYYYKTEQGEENFIYKVTLEVKEKKITADGFLDSGNSLVDPYTRIPVILMEQKLMEEFLGILIPDEKKILQGEISNEWRIIPYHSAGKEHGILCGIRLDYAIIERKGEKWISNKVIVAACPHLISGKKEYQMLIHRNLVKTSSYQK